jgi:hypothetical protein
VRKRDWDIDRYSVVPSHLVHSLQRWLRDNRIVPFPLFVFQDPTYNGVGTFYVPTASILTLSSPSLHGIGRIRTS